MIPRVNYQPSSKYFVTPVFSPACRSFFYIVRVQFKISLEEMRHICRRLGADLPPLWRSPVWELQVV
jgi:hypothetical protein